MREENLSENYRIRRSLISTGSGSWGHKIQEIIQDTVRLYLQGEDLTESPLMKWGRQAISEGQWWYGCEKKTGEEREQAIQARVLKVIDLYHSLKKQGYLGTPISVFFDDTGQIQLYDGFHRVSLMAMLDMDPVLNVVISYHDEDPKRRGDFPLVDALKELNGPSKNPAWEGYLYQPIDDPRLTNFHVWRGDSQRRLNHIRPHIYTERSYHITGETVLDIGCSEGFFSRALAAEGFRVTSLDNHKKRIAVARYLSIINNLRIEHITGSWESEVQGRTWDTILMLSVLHHHLLHKDRETVSGYLNQLRGCCRRLIVETPLTSKDVSWIDKPNAFKFTVEGLGDYLEETTGMKQIALFRVPGDLPPRDFEIPTKWARRPIFILEASL